MSNGKVKVTALGVTAEADPSVLDDYDLMERIIDLGSETWEANVVMCRALFGREGWEAVKDGLREDGKLTKGRVQEFILAAGSQVSALKN